MFKEKEEKTLFVELFQPFAQYRNPFTFYYAQTYPLPPKSTIIGMLQNAIGDWYGKNEEYEENGKIKNRWWDLRISVHGGFESVFWNYQQLIKGGLTFDTRGVWVNNPENKKNTWLPLYSTGLTSRRSPVYQQELFNGHLYIFLRGNANLLGKIFDSLKSLRKILYLGRSEDVIFVRNVVEVEPKKKDVDVKGDIKLKLPTYIKANNFPIKKDKYPVYSIPAKVVFKNNEKPVKSKAEITKNTKREVEFERVIYTGNDYSILLKQNINIELFEVGNNSINIIRRYGWL